MLCVSPTPAPHVGDCSLKVFANFENNKFLCACDFLRSKTLSLTRAAKLADFFLELNPKIYLIGSNVSNFENLKKFLYVNHSTLNCILTC